MMVKAILWTVAAFYACGAVVHLANISGWSGYTWTDAPMKWQALDIIYFVLDIVVAIGLALGWKSGSVAFYIAALSQIVLYSVFRAWIIDVPDAFVRSPEEIMYLDGLVVFHVVTIALVSMALWFQHTAASRTGTN